MLLPLAAAAACAEAPTSPGGGPPAEIRELPRTLSAAESAVAAAGNRFAFDLLRQVTASAPDSNVFLSPLSASMALGMAMSGAEGETFLQMRNTLGFTGMGREELGAAYRGLIELLRGLDRAVEFEIGNSVWVRQGFGVETSFLDFVRTSFDAGARTLDFADPEAAGIINGWASERTRGRIPTIVEPPIDPLTVMFLINAIYFKGDWREKFEVGRTRSETFHGVAGEGSVPLMRRDGNFRYRETATLQVVDLPYGGDAFSMTVVLPREGVELADVQRSMDPGSWDALVSGMAVSEGTVLLPRFRMEYRRDLNEDLQALGMTDAFDPGRADFTGMSGDALEQGLHVTRVLQKTFVSVDEEGTEAAAVTSVEMGVTSLPQRFTFRADRPFLFVIRERLSGTLLFAGVIVRAP
jgi:serine protease inhibitor